MSANRVRSGATAVDPQSSRWISQTWCRNVELFFLNNVEDRKHFLHLVEADSLETQSFYFNKVSLVSLINGCDWCDWFKNNAVSDAPGRRFLIHTNTWSTDNYSILALQNNEPQFQELVWWKLVYAGQQWGHNTTGQRVNQKTNVVRRGRKSNK